MSFKDGSSCFGP